MPGQKKLVIDAKVSLNAYQAAFEADDENERIRNLDLHAKSMRNHVQTLGSDVVDAFYVRDASGDKITDEDHLAEIELSVLRWVAVDF